MTQGLCHHRIQRSRIYLLLALLACLGLLCNLACAGQALAFAPQLKASSPNPTGIYVHWLRVDTHHPHTLFIGGTLQCALSSVEDVCPNWMMRSTDGGTTWTDLSAALGIPVYRRVYDISPPTIAADGQHIFTEAFINIGSPASETHSLLRSLDGGLHWSTTGPPDYYEGYGGGLGQVSPLPYPGSPIYAVDYLSGSVVSHDNGATWQVMGDPRNLSGNPTAFTLRGPLIPASEPGLSNTVYANVAHSSDLMPAFVARSNDAGIQWTMVTTPTNGQIPLHTFQVMADPSGSSELVGQTRDPGVPTDRRFFSNDQGRTWSVGTCPGDLNGQCPRIVAQHGSSTVRIDAFLANNIYSLSGTGLIPIAPTKTLMTEHGPVQSNQIIDVVAGQRIGDPIYLLASKTADHPLDNVHGLVYRSLDGGRTWQSLVSYLWSFPSTIHAVITPASPVAPNNSGVFFPHTGHTLSGPFLAFYRKYGGLTMFGYPRTEAFSRNGQVVQYTDRFQLILNTNMQITVAPLGLLLTAGRIFPHQAPVVTTGHVRYFPHTGYILSGQFLRYWNTHNGSTLLGEPISGIIKETNGDGSGRVYLMQWFTNGRLEFHPELAGTAYVIELGLTGKEQLRRLGWLP